MFVKPLILLSLLMASVGLLDAASSCAPSCLDAAVGDKVQVPWDCTKYAVCGDLHGDGKFCKKVPPTEVVIQYNGILWPSDSTSCPDDQYFNVDLIPPACAPVAGADEGFCDNYCSPCDPYWSFIGDLTPDPSNCGTFYTCVAGGQFVVFHCTDQSPDTPYYDYLTGICSSDQRACFNYCDSCQAYCVGETYVTDPLDCTAFYYCSPPEMTHFHCPVDENFDEDLKICSADAVCDPC